MMTPDTYNDDSNSAPAAPQALTIQEQPQLLNESHIKLKRKNIDDDDLDEENVSRFSKSIRRISTSNLDENCMSPSSSIRLHSASCACKFDLNKWIESFQLWSHSKQTQALSTLLDKCDNSIIKYVNNFIEPKLQKDYISQLPRELAFIILSNLHAKDLSKLSQVSTYWKCLADDRLVWRQLCTKNRIRNVDLSETSYFNTFKTINYWKWSYAIDYNVTLNWSTRALPKQVVLKGHDDHVITCLKFDNNCIVSGSDDNTLKIWCAKTGQIVQTLSGHTGGVWCSQLKENLLISGSTDRTVRVWRIDTGECLHVLTGHTSTVRCLALHGEMAISGSRDSSLRVWDIVSGKCLNILRGHVAAVRCVCFDGKYVVSGSYDFTVRVWNPYSKECVHKLEGHTNRVYSLLFDGKRIVSGSLDTTIIVWDVDNGKLMHKLEGHQSLTSRMQIKDDLLISGNADSTLKIWSLKSGKCVHTLGGDFKHASAVTCLVVTDHHVISSSDDGTVKLWNLDTGEFIRNLLTLDHGGYHGGVVWRICVYNNKLVCAVGSRNGVEDTKLILSDYSWPLEQSSLC